MSRSVFRLGADSTDEVSFDRTSGRTPPGRPSRVRRLRPQLERVEERILLSSQALAARAQAGSATTPGAAPDARPPEGHQAYVANLVEAIGLGEPALPDPVVTPWVRRLDRGMSPRLVARQIFRSPSVQARVADGVYEVLLGRAPSRAEADRAVMTLRARGSLRPVIFAIVSGEEYFRRNGGTPSGLGAALERDLIPGPSVPSATARAAPPTTRAERSRLAWQAMNRPDYGDPSLSQAYQGLTGMPLDPGLLARLTSRIDARGGLPELLARVAGDPAVVARLSARGGPSLAAKRVPGVLQVADPSSTPVAYTSIAYAAAPFQVSNVPDRALGAGDTDFWTINLNPSDSVSIRALDPSTQQPDEGIAIFVWQADATIADASGMPGPDVTYTLRSTTIGSAYIQAPSTTEPPATPTPSGVVKTPGAGGVSLLIGFARVGQAAPDPATATVGRAGARPGDPGAASFTAAFRTIPGVQTSTIDILENYHDPSYTYATEDATLAQIDDWPTFTPGEAAAYGVFTTIARNGAAASAASHGTAPGASALANFTDFRRVGSQGSPTTQVGYLEAVWAPIAAVIQDVRTGVTPRVDAARWVDGIPAVLVDGVHYAYGYTARQFRAAVVSPISSGAGPDGSPTASDFLSVHGLIASADAARAKLQAFIDGYKSWLPTQASLLSDVSVGVAELLSKGILDSSNQVPTLQAPVSVLGNTTFGLNLVSSAISTLTPIIGVFSEGAQAIGDVFGGLTSLAADITGDFAGDSAAQEFAAAFGEAVNQTEQAINQDTVTSQEILEAGRQLDEANQQLYLNSYLDMQYIASSMFSNYGLLQAFSGTIFPTVDVGGLSPDDLDDVNDYVDQVEDQVTRSYQLAAYLSLTPQFFGWENTTDDSADQQSTLDQTLSGLIPVQATMNADTRTSTSATYTYDQGLWYGLYSPPNSASPMRLTGAQADLPTAIRAMLVQFQGSVASQPVGAGSPNWVEQGTALQDGHANSKDWSVPLPFMGPSSILTPNTYVDDGGSYPLGRFFASVPVDFNYAISGDDFTGSGWGYYAMEWGLFNQSTGQAISPEAVEQLFGTLDLSRATLAYQDGYAYLEYETPADGLANLVDVFFSRGGWAIGGGGDASAYTPTLNGSGEVVGDAKQLDLGPTTQSYGDYSYSVTPRAASSTLPYSPLPASGSLGTSIRAPETGSLSIPWGSSIASPSGRFYLVFQADGNLVLYDARVANLPIWASGTYGHPSAELLFYPNGSLRIYDGGRYLWGNVLNLSSFSGGLGITLGVGDDGAVNVTVPVGPQVPHPFRLWTSQASWQGTTRDDAPQTNWLALAPGLDRGSILGPGASLSTGEYLLSPNGRFALVMQSNSRLIIYDLGSRTLEPIWAAGFGLATQGGVEAVMEAGGNFTISGNKSLLFQTGTSPWPGSSLKMQDDGNLVVYTPGGLAAWASNTLRPGKFVDPGGYSGLIDGYSGDALKPGQSLRQGQYLMSPNGQYALILQYNGDLNLYDLGAWDDIPLWSSGTSPDPSSPTTPTTLTFQSSTGQPLISRNGHHQGFTDKYASGNYLQLLDTGNLVLYSGGGNQTLWQTDTGEDD